MFKPTIFIYFDVVIPNHNQIKDPRKKMEKLIPLISDIQDIIRKSQVNLQISFPMIAVVGSQSVGKSSLLQSIISKQFLPKGKGIVTRRPIEIQLIQIQSQQQYGEIGHRKGEKIQKIEQFKKQIEQQMEKQCGGNKGISQSPLKIRFYSKNVLDLLLVDLPGIVKNPTGDQPRNIQEIVVKMIKNYIKNPKCIIVAVSKATDDLANSQSLKLARQVDRDGVRTLGVLTQVDQVDQGVNIIKQCNVLSNKLSLGYVCVYLRPSKSQLSLQQQRQKQIQFFKKHQQYSYCYQKMGVRYLTKILNIILINHIKSQLPVIRENIVYLCEEKKSQLGQYGEFQSITDKKAQGILVLALVSKYVKYFVQLIQGRHTQSRQAVIGGARIQYIFAQTFIKSINKMNPFEYLSDSDIRTAIRNANGLRKSLFLPEAAFENLLRTQISRLKLPSLQCAHLIHEQLRRLIHIIRIPQIQRFENLSIRIQKVMDDLLTRSLQKTEDMIRNLIQIQLGYINTNHPDFIDIISLVKTHPQQKMPQANNLEGNLDISFSSENPPAEFVQDSSMFKFQKNRPQQNTRALLAQSQILQGKLKQIHAHRQKKNIKKQQNARIQKIVKNQTLDNFYSSFAEHTNMPRYCLPQVPSVIKVSENPKLRQQTQTEMIKKLIVSYFNVVKKNINDSIPKTIVTFLVNHCKNCCEKILVNNLYVESQFESLLHEKDYIINQRDRLRKQIYVLKQCLDLINGIDSRLTV